MVDMMRNDIRDCPELMELIDEVGFMPLLESDIGGFSADEAVDPECRYRRLPDGGWDWPLWDWKGPMVREGGYAYGKFFAGKAGFVTMEWWPDFCNWRRSLHPAPDPDSVEGVVLEVLSLNGSMITRELRSACGFDGPKMRSRFDAYVTRLQMACRVVTEDFVYPTDRHGNRYGWGWALLNTPERLFSREACHCDRTPEQSLERMLAHLRRQLPAATEAQLRKVLG